AGIVDRVDELLLVGSPELHERPFEESAGQGDDAAVCSGGDATVDSTRGIDQREAGVSIAAHEVRHHAVTISGGKAAHTRCRIVLLGVRRHRSECGVWKAVAVGGPARSGVGDSTRSGLGTPSPARAAVPAAARTPT